MRKIQLLFVLLAVISVIFTSCKKDSTSKTKKEMLCKSWKLSSSTASGVAQTIEDCEKDDYTTFKTDGTFTDFVGTVKCDTDNVDESGTWTLSSDEKTLNRDGLAYTIVELSDSKLVVSFDTYIGTFVAK